jgi:hypothetical protein
MGEFTEVFPVLTGIAIGIGLGWLRPKMRLPIGAVLAILGGVLATVVSGEFRLTWAYLLIDIPLVAGASILALAVARRIKRRRIAAVRQQSE